MSAIFASVRVGICALASGLVLLCQAGASAQELPSEKVTGADLRRALIWTGHYSAFADGDPMALVTKAAQAWQKSKNYPVTETLPPDQLDELVAEGLRKHDAAGWATLHDKSVGFAIGVPTRLVKFVGTHTQNQARIYDFEGSVGYQVSIRYGDWHCGTLPALYAQLQRLRPYFLAYGGDWIAYGEDRKGHRGYERVVCRPSGALVASVDMVKSQLAEQGALFAAMAESMTISRFFNPTALPRPRIDDGSPGPPADEPSGPRTAAKAADEQGDGGKTDAIKREQRSGQELRAEEVFQKVSGAVYVVRTDKGLGSAVAVSEDFLLTNCHVVGDQAKVRLVHDKKEFKADVVSQNPHADRCVLKADEKLPQWVTVRPYEDIRVGERALTVGTPYGLEQTVAEGIVSSKRTKQGSRLVQTSAPISPGSSGGGLFDAQGHLLGITTFYLRGSQNLNFAVAAEDYVK